MEKVQLRPFFHRGKECIGIYFETSFTLNALLKQKAGARWSHTQKCWYVPLSREDYNKVWFALRGKAELEEKELHHYLAEKKKGKAADPVIPGPAPHPEPVKPRPEIKPVPVRPGQVKAVNAGVLPALKQELVLKGYSSSTIKTYINEVRMFLVTIGDHPAAEFTPQRLRDYLQYCFEVLKLSENTLHSRINALKFYYEKVLKRERFFWDIPRPQKPLQLPKLLNEEELSRLFNALQNRKHKAMLFTAYSAGLRVSEIVNLEIADIDGQRLQIHVRNAKGKKDRYVNLSPVLLDILREYINTVKPAPRVYLFESEQTGQAYPTRTVQQIFTNAKRKARILKDVGIHSLRHSFATHLLDKGTDIRYIKELLGHFNIKTTERYLHVSKKQLVNIISPFDDLWKKNSLSW
ncbi:MAG: tyrosine-type recombinase/integrase [Sphingobacteriales bacterium]|nr:tyrosine-type recombinase/integrase [Sphingobacteriales bacterium]